MNSDAIMRFCEQYGRWVSIARETGTVQPRSSFAVELKAIIEADAVEVIIGQTQTTADRVTVADRVLAALSFPLPIKDGDTVTYDTGVKKVVRGKIEQYILSDGVGYQLRCVG